MVEKYFRRGSPLRNIITIMIDEHDPKKGYCRKLGHYIEFKYCRLENNGIPCGKILDCWFKIFPVEEFVDSNYTDEEKMLLFKPQAPKISSLIELIEKARKASKE